MNLKKRVKDFCLWQLIGLYNKLFAANNYSPPTTDNQLATIQRRSEDISDISEHLEKLYVESLMNSPTTIVEIGVRNGTSTFVFEKVARRCESDLVSVDIADCSDACDYENWHFVQSDGVEFGENWGKWAKKRNINEDIDIFFLDTTHYYEETMEEIMTWFPHLSDSSVAFFHDTNMKTVYKRRNGSLGKAFNNREVTAAIEDYFDIKLNNNKKYQTIVGDKIIQHDPYCNGMTIIKNRTN